VIEKKEVLLPTHFFSYMSKANKQKSKRTSVRFTFCFTNVARNLKVGRANVIGFLLLYFVFSPKRSGRTDPSFNHLISQKITNSFAVVFFSKVYIHWPTLYPRTVI